MGTHVDVTRQCESYCRITIGDETQVSLSHDEAEALCDYCGCRVIWQLPEYRTEILRWVQDEG